MNTKAKFTIQTSQVHPGTVLIVKEGFDCLKVGEKVEVKEDLFGKLYVSCAHGKHMLDEVNGEYLGFELYSEDVGSCSVKEFATRVHRAPKTVRKWLREGKIVGYKLGGEKGNWTVAGVGGLQRGKVEIKLNSPETGPTTYDVVEVITICSNVTSYQEAMRVKMAREKEYR